MHNKKICIVTNYSLTTNFGALLQAYALNRAITNLGYFAEDLFVVSDHTSQKNKLLRQLKKFQFKKIKNEIVSYIQKYKVRDHLNARKKVMDEFRFSIPHTEKYTKDHIEDLQQRYDVFICGSDQIFRPNKRTGELDNVFFLTMVNNGAVKASYAASIGIASYDPVTEKKAAEYLSSFDKISMREAGAAEYISRITGRQDVVASVDPVFLVDRDEWISLSRPYNIEGKYILVYMIHGTERLFRSIKKFATENSLKIVTFPSMSYKRKAYEVGFADIDILDADPFQFISLISNAEYFFTDSFHGTAFSLILHQSAFVSRANEIAFSRIENILNITHAEKLVIPSDGLSYEKYNIKPEINWDIVDSAIKKQCEMSIEYLKEVIEL